MVAAAGASWRRHLLKCMACAGQVVRRAFFPGRVLCPPVVRESMAADPALDAGQWVLFGHLLNHADI